MTHTIYRPPVLFLSDAPRPWPTTHVDPRTPATGRHVWQAQGHPHGLRPLGERPRTLSATGGIRPWSTDFGGLPQKYHEVAYDAPQAPELAAEVESSWPVTATTWSATKAAGWTMALTFAEGDVPRRRRAGGADVDADVDPQGLFGLACRWGRCATGTPTSSTYSPRTTWRWFNLALGPEHWRRLSLQLNRRPGRGNHGPRRR